MQELRIIFSSAVPCAPSVLPKSHEKASGCRVGEAERNQPLRASLGFFRKRGDEPAARRHFEAALHLVEDSLRVWKSLVSDGLPDDLRQWLEDVVQRIMQAQRG